MSVPALAPGSRSLPVAWSTSRMDRESRVPEMDSTLTHTCCPRFTASLALPTLRALACSAPCAAVYESCLRLAALQ